MTSEPTERAALRARSLYLRRTSAAEGGVMVLRRRPFTVWHIRLTGTSLTPFWWMARLILGIMSLMFGVRSVVVGLCLSSKIL